MSLILMNLLRLHKRLELKSDRKQQITILHYKSKRNKVVSWGVLSRALKKE
ncbi:hypothetical protein PO124_24245 [Bacillus licheniformis]|nr:hypothetical protein [Bacillus licheniformis]